MSRFAYLLMAIVSVISVNRPASACTAAGRVDSGELKDLYSGLDSLIREACGRYLPDNE